MSERSLSNIQLRQIEQEIDKISAICDDLTPESLEDAEKLARYDEILNYYESLLKNSFKKARIAESGLSLI